MDLYFYNYWHNGDIHYSREFVKDIISKTNFDNYFYAHNNKIGLLKDIKELREIDFFLIGTDKLNSLDCFYEDGDIFINTWIGKSAMKYTKFGININSNYMIYEEIYKFLNIKLNDDKNIYLPTINFDFIDNKKFIELFFKNRKNKNILICNGRVCSGQSTNESLEPFIVKLSKEFPNINFIFTDNSNKVEADNIFYTSDIINLGNKTDLNEISYLSTFCDIIIGKESGPFAFCTIKDNLNDENKTFINFCHTQLHVWYTNGNCKYVWTNNYNQIYETIKKIILKYEN